MGRRRRRIRCKRSGTRSSSCATIAHLRPRTNTFGAVRRVRNCVCKLDPRLLPGRRLSVHPHADHHRQRLRRGGRDVPRHHARPRQTAQGRRARSTTRYDFFDRPAYLTVSGQLEGEIFACGAGQDLHLRPDLPRRELEHVAAPGRVLDGRAGDGLLRPADNMDLAERLSEAHLPRRARTLPRRHAVLQRADRQDGDRHAASTSSTATSSACLHRSDRDPGEVRREVRVSRSPGASICKPSTSAT